MKFTFGIITAGNDNFIHNIINSIESQIPPDCYEIIIIGNSSINKNNTKIIPFDENIKPMWITKKKNIITENAKFENIVYMHDYISLESNWYNGFLQFGDDFNACMTKIINTDGSRFRDWTLFPLFSNVQALNIPKQRNLLPYNITHMSKYQYFSGAYWVAKKSIMQEFPLNEALSWGQSEDIDWSQRYTSKYVFSINPLSTVKLLKFKPRIFDELTSQDLQKINGIK